jgi:sialidase-1
VPALDPGQGANVKVPVTVAAGASGGVKLTAAYRTEGKLASGSSTVTVTP